jgi:hypothetical protein
MKKLTALAFVFLLMAQNTAGATNAFYYSFLNNATGAGNLAGAESVAVTKGGSQTFQTTTQAIANLSPIAPLAKRAPTSTDDTTLGYKVGDFWSANGRQWVMTANGTGTANWQPMPTLSAPACDVVTGAAGCYGVYLMKASYSGNAFQITRSSDSTTLNIPFVNGIASWAMVDNFCVGTVCGVSDWYDQSGNGYDITQATFASMPKIKGGTVGTLRGITFFDGNSTASYLSNASLPITSRNNFTVLTTIEPVNSSNATYNPGVFGLNASASNWFYYTNVGLSGGGLEISSGGTNIDTNGVLYANAQVFVTSNNSGNFTTTQNNVVLGPITSSFSSVSSTGIIVGSSQSAGYGIFQGAMTSFIIYNSTLSAANQQLEQQAAFRDTGIIPQAKVNVVLFASSLICCSTSGLSPVEQSFVGQFQNAFNDPVNIVAYGYGNTTIVTLNTYMAAFLARAKISNQQNVVVLDGASNDLAFSSGATGSSVYSSVQSGCTIAHTATFLCYPMSTFPRQSGFSGGQTNAGFETARQSLIGLELAGWPSFADGFVDAGHDPVIGPQSAALNLTLFNSDEVHVAQPVGTSYEKSIHVRALKGLVQ